MYASNVNIICLYINVYEYALVKVTSMKMYVNTCTYDWLGMYIFSLSISAIKHNTNSLFLYFPPLKTIYFSFSLRCLVFVLFLVVFPFVIFVSFFSSMSFLVRLLPSRLPTRSFVLREKALTGSIGVDSLRRIHTDTQSRFQFTDWII